MSNALTTSQPVGERMSVQLNGGTSLELVVASASAPSDLHYQTILDTNGVPVPQRAALQTTNGTLVDHPGSTELILRYQQIEDSDGNPLPQRPLTHYNAELVVTDDAGIGATRIRAPGIATAQAAAAAAQASANAAMTQLVFQPGGVASQNVFTDWATLVTFAATIAAPKVIIFDDSIAACVIPVGAWDLGRGCQFRGFVPSGSASASALRTDISCANGVTFVTPIYSLQDVRLLYSGTGALMTIPGTGRRWNFYLTGNAVCATTGAGGRIFDLVASSSFAAFFTQQSFVTVAGGSFFWAAAATATAAILVTTGDGFNPPSAGARLPSNSLSGAAGPAYQFVQDFTGMLSTTQASMPGGVITVGTEASPANIPYTPSTPARWNGNPTQLQQAIDRIAAVVGATIPIP